MIQNYDKFSIWNAKFNKIFTLWKFYIYLTMINKKHVMYWDNYMYFLIQVAKDFIQIFFIWKSEKGLKKIPSPFVK